MTMTRPCPDLDLDLDLDLEWDLEWDLELDNLPSFLFKRSFHSDFIDAQIFKNSFSREGQNDF